MNSRLARCLLAVCLVAIGFGISTTYERYRGTGLSRVPELPVERPAAVLPQATDAQQDDVVAAIDAPLPVQKATATAAHQELTLYPTLVKGMRTPLDLWKYYGRGVSSYTSPILPMHFDKWLSFHRKQKPSLMHDVKTYISSRFDFSGAFIPDTSMSGGKPVMLWPVARLQDVASY